MKPDWDKLAEAFDGSSKVLIADVDCTEESGKDLCERFGVQGFPTIKYFNPPDDEGEDYQGGRTYDDLKKFADSNLGPGCALNAKENCSPEQLKEIDALSSMSKEDKDAELGALKKKIDDMEEAHKTLLEGLQKQYEDSNSALEQAKEEAKPRMKILKMAGAGSAMAAGGSDKDEV